MQYKICEYFMEDVEKKLNRIMLLVLEKMQKLLEKD